MMDRNEIREAARQLDAVRRAVGKAMLRRPTYKAAVKEFLMTGVNLAMYPTGVLSKTLSPDPEVRFSGRFDRRLPLRYLDPEAANIPIVLIHGYFHNRSAFTLTRRSLKHAGFRSVSAFNYNVIGHDVRQIAASLAEHVDRVMKETGASQVHLVGHSLGGLIARAYIQLCGGEPNVHTCITLGTPHQGTYSAVMARGKAARDLRPESPLIQALRDAPASNVRYVSYYSNLDVLVVPATSAKIESPKLRARNVLVKDQGHMSMLISQSLMDGIIDTLWHLSDEARFPETIMQEQAE